MARGIVGAVKGPFLTPKQLDEFTREWDCTRAFVLKGLNRRKEVRNGQSSGKIYGHR